MAICRKWQRHVLWGCCGHRPCHVGIQQSWYPEQTWSNDSTTTKGPQAGWKSSQTTRASELKLRQQLDTANRPRLLQPQKRDQLEQMRSHRHILDICPKILPSSWLSKSSCKKDHVQPQHGVQERQKKILEVQHVRPNSDCKDLQRQNLGYLGFLRMQP